MNKKPWNNNRIPGKYSILSSKTDYSVLTILRDLLSFPTEMIAV